MENNKNNIYNYEQTLRGGQTHATRVTSLLQGKQQDTTASRGTCAELSLLKLCHGEKECHEMEQLRGDTWLSGQYYAGNASSCEQGEAL